MLCLLLTFLVRALANREFFPFEERDLPFNRRIEITTSAGGESVTIPIHFGPTGTEAWESIFIAFTDFTVFSFRLVDCFCSGDRFQIHLRALDAPTQFTLTSDKPPGSDDCAIYSDDPETCLLNGSNWSRIGLGIGTGGGRLYNLTITTLSSPYGGGVAFFRYFA